MSVNDSSQHGLNGKSGLEGIDLAPHRRMKGLMKGHPPDQQGLRQVLLETAGLEFGLERVPDWSQVPSSLPSNL